jgi:hypothetical protein
MRVVKEMSIDLALCEKDMFCGLWEGSEAALSGAGVSSFSFLYFS